MKREIMDVLDDCAEFSNEEKTQAIMRCVDVIDYLYETASKMAVSFILTQPSGEPCALSNQPKELAIKAMATAMRQVACGGRRSDEPVH